jgi:nucleoporin NUP82
MPKVISYTPPWLSRPFPGAALFSSPAPKDPASSKSTKDTPYLGPSRTLARRGNEVFTVVDNQIRWSSLTRLKDDWQQRARSKSQKPDADAGAPYRVRPAHCCYYEYIFY